MPQAVKIEGMKSTDYSFDFEGSELKYTIQEPTFDQITAALSQVKATGQMDMIGSGKVIWELCCIKADKKIEDNPRVLISVCIELASEFALPVDIEIKKK